MISSACGLAVAMYSVFCLLASAYVLQPPFPQKSNPLRCAAPIAAEPLRFEVCQNKYCKKKGAVKTLALFEELAEGRDDVLVEKADMSHTEHGCFDECTMGPNVRIGGDGPKTDSLPFGAGRVENGVKGEEAIKALLDKAAA